MEPYIKDNISDITYMSELTPAASLCEAAGVKFAHITYVGVD